MAVGRKMKPLELKILAGNPGKRKIPHNVPKSISEIGAAPKWFTKEQKVAWRHVVRNAPPGLLTIMDRALLVVWVTASDIHRQACEAMLIDGLIVKSQKGLPIQNTYLSIKNRQAEIMMKASSELGFSPTSRGRVVPAVNQASTINKFSIFDDY